jgi:predicted nuclease of predicted toxin-antitoxin system
MPRGNRTSDESICSWADEVGAVVITKDADFVISRALRRTPCRLLLVSTGNIGNRELIQLIADNIPVIAAAFKDESHVELSRDSLIIHE